MDEAVRKRTIQKHYLSSAEQKLVNLVSVNSPLLDIIEAYSNYVELRDAYEKCQHEVERLIDDDQLPVECGLAFETREQLSRFCNSVDNYIKERQRSQNPFFDSSFQNDALSSVTGLDSANVVNTPLTTTLSSIDIVNRALNFNTPPNVNVQNNLNSPEQVFNNAQIVTTPFSNVPLGNVNALSASAASVLHNSHVAVNSQLPMGNSNVLQNNNIQSSYPANESSTVNSKLDRVKLKTFSGRY